MKNGERCSCFWKAKVVGVENVEDNDEDVNQFEEMPLFSNPMNIKHIKKTLMRTLCPICEKVAIKNLYKNYVSHFILMLVFIYMDFNLSHIIYMDLNLFI
jgi:hypothetical protein